MRINNRVSHIVILIGISFLIQSGCAGILGDEQIIPATFGVPITISLDSHEEIFNAQNPNSNIIKLASKKKWDVGYYGFVITVKDTFIERSRKEIESDIYRWIEGLVQDDNESVERQKGTQWEVERYTEIEVIVQLPNRKKIGRGHWSKDTQEIKVELF